MTASVLSIDLAAKFSAAILRGAGGEVLEQFDSRNRSEADFCAEISFVAEDTDIVVIEDVPYGISSQFMIKPVLRLQGRLISHLELSFGVPEKTIFMIPSVWMKEFPGVSHAPRGMNKSQGDKARIEAAAHYAAEGGYQPPDLVSEYVASLPEGKRALKKDTNVLAKSMTDYVSAWLMSEYCRMHTFEQLVAMNGVERLTK